METIWLFILLLAPATYAVTYPKCVVYTPFVHHVQFSPQQQSPHSPKRIHDERHHPMAFPIIKWNNCEYCGIPSFQRIVNGNQAIPHEYPWLVSIRKDGIQHCGGAIINDRYILTAAHCTLGVQHRELIILAGVHDVMDTKVVRVHVQRIIVHPRYEPKTYNNDIALLKLGKRLKLSPKLRPICLPPENYECVGRIGMVGGWGATAEDSESSNLMMKVELPIVSNDECRRAKGLQKYKVTDNMICAGFISGNKDACKGDSGGPMVLQEKGLWYQIGIVSWGVGCARPDYYGVYTKVNRYLTWLAQNTMDAMC